MILYPTRNQISKKDYQAKCVGGDVWELIHLIATHRKFIRFPPGNLSFGTVGFLGSFPGFILLIFLYSTIFRTKPMDFRGYFMAFGIAFVVLLHGLFMLRVVLGQVYAQQDLVTYLRLMFAMCCGFIVFALLKGVSLGYMLFPLAATILAGFLFWLSRSASFTSFAEFTRVKWIYMTERDRIQRALREAINKRR
jgi:hypothetical protein